MGIETLPCIESLERLIQKLPQEHRAEVYMAVESFYHIGAGDGAMAGAMSTASLFSGRSAEPKEDKSRLYHDYFTRRISEAERASSK